VSGYQDSLIARIFGYDCKGFFRVGQGLDLFCLYNLIRWKPKLLSYNVSTVGLDEEQIRKYIRDQEKFEKQ